MTTDTRILRSGAWRVRGRPDILPSIDDGYVRGVTPATPANMGSRIPEADYRPDDILTGTITLEEGSSLEGKLIRGNLVTIGECFVRDVIVDVRPPVVPATSPTVVHGITSWTSTSEPTLEFVTVQCKPENRSWRVMAGIHGAGITMRRVHVWGMTDGFVFSGAGRRSFFRAYDCLIEKGQKYDYDGHNSHPSHPAGLASFPGSHSDGSHPDSFYGGGNLTEVILEGLTVATSNTAGGLITQDAGTYDLGVKIRQSTFYIDDPAFGAVLNIKNTQPVIEGVEITDNVFPITSRPRMVMSPEQLTATQITSHGVGRNTYTDGTYPVPVHRGGSVAPTVISTYGSPA